MAIRGALKVSSKGVLTTKPIHLGILIYTTVLNSRSLK